MRLPTFFASPARQRMAVLCFSTALFIFADTIFGTIGPLWITQDRGMNNSSWAFLRSARFGGTFLGIIALGIVVERLGSRRMSALTLSGAGLALAGIATGLPPVLLIPFFGAFISTTHVNFNAMTQRVSSHRQGLANALFRSTGAVSIIVAPMAATQAAYFWGSYTPVIMAAGIVLGIAGLVILAYPETQATVKRQSLAEVMAAFRHCFALRPLLEFVGLGQAFAISVAPVVAFAALRFTSELQLSSRAFGVLSAAIAVGTLVVTLASGWLMQRLRPNVVVGLTWLGCSSGALAMGLSDSLPVAIAAYAIFAPLLSMRSVPTSLWISRIADAAGPTGPSQTMVFTVDKIIQAAATMVVMSLVGLLEPHVGMARLMWIGGLLGLPLAFAVIRLGAFQERSKLVRFDNL